MPRFTVTMADACMCEKAQRQYQHIFAKDLSISLGFDLCIHVHCLTAAVINSPKSYCNWIQKSLGFLLFTWWQIVDKKKPLHSFCFDSMCIILGFYGDNALGGSLNIKWFSTTLPNTGTKTLQWKQKNILCVWRWNFHGNWMKRRGKLNLSNTIIRWSLCMSCKRWASSHLSCLPS